MATGRLPDPNSSPLTAKGDLYTYSTVPAKLAIGSNGETLVADSSTSTGLRWQGSAIGKNAIYNSAFDIWQRGTTFAAATNTNVYCADRWFLWRSTTGATASRQTGTNNNQYEIRIQRDSGTTATNAIYLAQAFEISDAIQYQGKTVTLSFWARAGANYSRTSNGLTVVLNTGTGTTDRNPFTASYTGSASPINTSVTLTTSWQRFSVSGTLGSTVTQFTPYFEFAPTGTAGAADYFEISNVQLELGSVATPYSKMTNTLAGELAACQRYYYRITTSTAYGDFGAGYQKSTTVGSYMIPFPVIMRTAPTALEQTGTASNYNILHQSAGAAARTTCSSVPTFQTATTAAARVDATVASGLTAGNGGIFGADNNTTAYLAWSAEL